MADIYRIGSEKGYKKAMELAPGESWEAGDKSIWTKNADGTISVLHNGKTMVGQLAFDPMAQQQLPGQAFLQQNIASMPGGSGYESPYAQKLQQAIDDVQGSRWTGWNPDTDESMQAYRKQYLREADRSMEDVLGQYAQNTGGIAGSQAIAAASQAVDYYKAQLSDKVPQLYENAYSRYLNEVAQKQNIANLLMSAENQAQSQYYQQIDYALNKWASMGYADQEVAGILGVTAGTPTSNQSYTDWNTAFQKDQADFQKEQYEYEKQLAAQKRTQAAFSGDEAETPTAQLDEARIQSIISFANAMTKSNQPQDVIYRNLLANGYTIEEMDEAWTRMGW